MTLKYPERVQESTSSTGTGDLVLLGAPDTSYNEFGDRFSNGDTTDVAIFGAGAFELCRATYNTGANSITRGTIYDSSNSGSRVTFGAGTKTVIVCAPGATFKTLQERSDEIAAAIADVASASTCDIGAAASWRVRITGTTTITSFGTGANKLRIVVFAGALVLTHNATSLILPTGANITTAAGDTAWFQSDGSGNWRCIGYMRADGTPLAVPAGAVRYDAAQSLTTPQRTQVLENIGLYVPPGVMSGLTLANDTTDATNDISIAPGFAGDSTGTLIIRLASGLIKRLDADWAAGTNQGMRRSAGGIANGTYHIYLVSKTAGADPDIYADSSANAATALANLQAETGGSAYAYAVMIGSIIRRSGVIEPFVQDGDEFTLKTPIQDMVQLQDPGVGPTLRTITVPTGIRVAATLSVSLNQASVNAGALFTDPSTDDVTPSSGLATVFASGAAGGGSPVIGMTSVTLFTNTSAQVRTRLTSSNSATYLSIATFRWRHPRGKN